VTQTQKILKSFLENPQSCRYRDVVKVLKLVGFIEVSVKGSHVKFKHSQLPQDLVIPVHNKECKEFYKREAKKLVELILNT
jgi:predicted RNA binding protein YcfA (HicA-like mRNA interferase family)